MIIDMVKKTEHSSVIVFAAYLINNLENVSEELKQNVNMVFQTHVSSEIENSLEMNIKLNEDLLEINETSEDELFFDLGERELIQPRLKKKLLKKFAENEVKLMRELSQSL